MQHRPELGRWGESLAAEHLKHSGYAILERNVRSRFGEIDIVAKDGDCLVFVEVRTKETHDITPEESITPAKQRKLATLIAWYLRAHRITSEEWRGDVIAIQRGEAGEVERLEHYVSAVEDPD